MKQTFLTIYNNGTVAELLMLVEFSETHLQVLEQVPMWRTSKGKGDIEYISGGATKKALELIERSKPTITGTYPHNIFGSGSPMEALYSYLLDRELAKLTKGKSEQFFLDLLDKSKD